MKQILKIFFAITVILVIFSSCTSNPNYYVDSYDELKEVFKNEPDFFFPDVSKYEFINETYVVGHKPTNKKILTSYSIYGDIIDQEKSDSVLYSFDVGCYKPKLFSDKSNPIRKLELNTEYFGVRMFERNADISYKANTEGSTAEKFSKGSFVFRFYYEFDLDSCRYKLTSNLFISPEDLQNTDTDALTQQGKEELLKIAESIINQRSDLESWKKHCWPYLWY